MPHYDPLLRAFHVAFEQDLRRIVQDLRLSANAKVLDLCCGDGFYSCLLGEALGPNGLLVAVDQSRAYLTRAEKRVAQSGLSCRPRFELSDAYALPFEDAKFDLAWCAHSFISLGDPVLALKEMRRVVRPGGVVAILECDEYHHVLLPWPVELEIALQRAVAEHFREKYGEGEKAAPARSLARMLRQAGLRPRRKRTYSADRQPPFVASTRRFVDLYLKSLGKLVQGRLSAEEEDLFRRLTDVDSNECFQRRQDVDLTCLNVLFLGDRGVDAANPQLRR